MVRSARLLIVVCAALAVLAGGCDGVWAGKAAHMHHCEGMVAGMTMDDCLHGDANGGGEPHGCPPAVCGGAALFLVPQSSNVFFIATSIVSSVLPRDEGRSRRACRTAGASTSYRLSPCLVVCVSYWSLVDAGLNASAGLPAGVQQVP